MTTSYPDVLYMSANNNKVIQSYRGLCLFPILIPLSHQESKVRRHIMYYNLSPETHFFAGHVLIATNFEDNFSLIITCPKRNYILHTTMIKKPITTEFRIVMTIQYGNVYVDKSSSIALWYTKIANCTCFQHIFLIKLQCPARSLVFLLSF